MGRDIVIASPNASFCLPEGKRGLAALAGALPRIIRNFGLQRAMDLGLTGRALSAEEARRWGLVKEIVPVSEVVARAVQIATSITELSPESVIVTRAGIRQGWESGSVDRATANTAEVWRHKLFTGDNIKEGRSLYTYYLV
jgi:enoyl-CoA hydratase/carnithine racemase